MTRAESAAVDLAGARERMLTSPSTCTLTPSPHDRRFSDSPWTENALQGYLAGARRAETLVEDACLARVDESWQASASIQAGSWWPDFAAWLGERAR